MEAYEKERESPDDAIFRRLQSIFFFFFRLKEENGPIPALKNQGDISTAIRGDATTKPARGGVFLPLLVVIRAAAVV